MSNSKQWDLPDALRRRLEDDPALQARLDALGALLVATRENKVGDDDEDMIDLLVSEALDGVDIRTRYPDVFERLLAVPDLHELFVAALESFETIPAGVVTQELERSPVISERLPNAVVRPTGEAGVWQAQWQLAADLLGTLFQPAETVLRTGSPDEEERWVTLLRDEVGVGHGRVVIVLDGRLNDDGQLAPELKLAFEAPENRGDQPFEAWGLLAWGPHRVEIPGTREYRTTLHALDLGELLEPDTLAVRAPLSLSLFFRISDETP